MDLGDDDVRFYRDEGYVLIRGCFSREEVAVLKRQGESVVAGEREERWGPGSGYPNTVFAMHTYNEAFRRLATHPRVVRPAERLLAGRVYLHQFKLVAKGAFDGEGWGWHQDYAAWGPIDGMPQPRALNMAVFLDDVTEANGPLLFVPGSHRIGGLDADHRLVAEDGPLWSLDRETVSKLAERGGCVAVTGAAGTMVAFSSLLVHASPANISPYDRAIVYLSLSHEDNQARRFERPAWVAHRDFTPVDAGADDCLIDLTRGDGRHVRR